MASQPQGGGFKALKVPSSSNATSPTPPTEQNGISADPKSAAATTPMTTRPEDISSPHELTAFVETLLAQLENKFDDMSSQILERMSQMSTRVDSLELSIQDLINGDVSVPQSPTPGFQGGGGALGRKGIS